MSASAAPDPRQLSIQDFTYQLPPERIAPEPLANRDQSRLLYYNAGQIEDRRFQELPSLLPTDALLVFNDTKVVRARLFAHKPTGGLVELFCLEPVAPHKAIEPAMQQTGSCVWKCLVGNGKRWKAGPVLLEFSVDGQPALLTAERLEQGEGFAFIRFSWEPAGLPFAEVLRAAGHLPLPPYLNRPDTDVDAVRYQTVYAAHEGAVAAPTAGLHFSDAVLDELQARHIASARVTLHVGAGTFQPVKASQMLGHPMHGEPISVTAATLRQLLGHWPRPILAVGTTSLRTLESLYWLGARLVQQPEQAPTWHVGQWQPYEGTADIPAEAALQALLTHLESTKAEELHATTQLLIAPGYQFRLIKGLITNFHQPESTLLLLVAALVGPEWRHLYAHALENNYRFLSYGDSSLLLP
ncbi:S-adenosylmethionine:tRNA ribosyltransferase-isomerase [Hymenobacter taeanensis]|uniref:S-adenosylmethionine:tRNA ribosyltransferase-isomerase n=1 Tax=Hymenobacter taeanensis TaxID=2735321 RepID=A0A6M6BCW6_9BACT|nr:MULTISPECIES: S-adenosylmethionine:tRNA ribosyltransferase-isomerase [Hymenobacter]QJX45770.1 S-adenosylmethionine:tRNA ribosyltransferase-isomerase [Hymenobacter taeanensis]UOQ79613.1 S-adenosylmethionine:tRNA ribosyltransferase-isomerase [Hymenobacter sp. 5414T-23]